MDGWSPLSEMKKFGYKRPMNTYYVYIKDSSPGGKQAAKLVSHSFCISDTELAKNGGGKHWFGFFSCFFLKKQSLPPRKWVRARALKVGEQQ